MPSIYIVFSSTPYKMGAFIRAVTRSKFNHVSVAFDEKLSETYSFARLYRNTPFCGGFVHETADRFTNLSGDSQIKICELKLTEEQIGEAKSFINEVKESREKFVYNFLSAAAYMLKRKVTLPRAYTCLEFVSEVFRRVGLPIPVKNGSFLTVDSFSEMLSPLAIYEGSYIEYTASSTADSAENAALPDFFDRIKLTVCHSAKLISQAFKNLFAVKRTVR